MTKLVKEGNETVMNCHGLNLLATNLSQLKSYELPTSLKNILPVIAHIFLIEMKRAVSWNENGLVCKLMEVFVNATSI